VIVPSLSLEPPASKLHVSPVQRTVKLACRGALGANVAVTERAWSIVTWQLPVPEQSPDQPAKTEPTSGVAVKVTVVP
jgi:hypothetical protein